MQKLVVFLSLVCGVLTAPVNPVNANDCNTSLIPNPIAGEIAAFVIQAYLPSGEMYTEANLTDLFTIDLNSTHITAESSGYHVSFVVFKAGPFNMSVFLDGQHIHGSPFSLQCLPGPVAPSHCGVSGAITTGDANRVQTFYVHLTDAYDNPTYNEVRGHNVSVTMTSNTQTYTITTIHDMVNGTFTVNYNVSAGTYITQVSVDDEAVGGSPFRTVVRDTFVARLRKGDLSPAEAFGVALAVLLLVILLIICIAALCKARNRRLAPLAALATVRKQQYQSVVESMDSVELEA